MTKSPVIHLKPRLGEYKRNLLMLAFKSASSFPPCLHSALSLSRGNMDTTCFGGTAHFPSRAQPKSFSIDWILSSGPAFASHAACTQPQVIMRGGLFPAATHRPFVAAFGSGYVYTPHFYHHHNAACRYTETRRSDGHQSGGLPYAGEFGLKTCRRMRTVFSAEQLHKLEEVFAKQRYMTGSEKVLLASALRLTETQVKVWFQNRRTKWRKNREVEERPNNQCSDLKHEISVTDE